MKLLAHSGPAECYREEGILWYSLIDPHNISPFEASQCAVSLYFCLMREGIPTANTPSSTRGKLRLITERIGSTVNLKVGYKDSPVFSKHFRNFIARLIEKRSLSGGGPFRVNCGSLSICLGVFRISRNIPPILFLSKSISRRRLI